MQAGFAVEGDGSTTSLSKGGARAYYTQVGARSMALMKPLVPVLILPLLLLLLRQLQLLRLHET